MLYFEQRCEGFRVFRGGSMTTDASGASVNVGGVMIASIETMTRDDEKSAVRPDKQDEKTGARILGNPNGATYYKALPSNECKIHSAVGALSVAEIKEIIEHIENL